MILVLENIRSVYNVGSIFRTMNGFGFKEVALIGITPTPLDKFGNKRKDFQKTALGAEETITWKHYSDMKAFLEENKEVVLLACEETEKALSLETITEQINIVSKDTYALVFGSEVDGVSKSTLEKSKFVFKIPMLGTKESFNVSVAAGIVLYEVTRGGVEK